MAVSCCLWLCWTHAVPVRLSRPPANTEHHFSTVTSPPFPQLPRTCPHNTSSFPCLAPWMHAGEFLCGLFWQQLSEPSWSFNGWVISDSVMLFLLLSMWCCFCYCQSLTHGLSLPWTPPACLRDHCALLKLHILLLDDLNFFFNPNTAMCPSSLRPDIEKCLTPLFWKKKKDQSEKT